MGKIVSIVGGAVAIMVGIILIFAWNEAFVLGLQFSVMFILILGGLIAVIAGISEIKDAAAAKKQEDKPQEPKPEENKQ
jgi:fructose-specific phosphotransferase system IIC component